MEFLYTTRLNQVRVETEVFTQLLLILNYWENSTLVMVTQVKETTTTITQALIA